MIVAEANFRLKQLISTSRSHIGSGTDVPFLGFEYDAAVAALMEITLQHAEAFYELAKCDERFFFSAASCARSAMEAAVTLAWICDPKDKIEKEGRWLGYYDGLAKFHANMAKELGESDPELPVEINLLNKRHEEVRNRTIAGKPIPIEAKPSMEQMMTSLGYKELYTSYRELCHIIHIGPEMVCRFKQGVHFDNGLSGFRITQRTLGGEWDIPFLVIGWSIALSVIATLVELGDSAANLRPVHDAQKALMEYVKK
jgi:hypothetical protein